MTYRIDMRRGAPEVVLEFQGLLDRAALEDLRARIGAIAAPVRLVLRAGTDADPACVADLRRLGAAAVVAESAFLSRWLQEELP